MAVTRADVAAMAKVSPAIVSYVTNGGPRPVSAGARRRVEAAIETLGYRPNAIAAALRGGTMRSIGLLMPSSTNPFFAELAEALVIEFFDRGNTLSIGVTDDDPNRESLYLHSYLDRRVDGIVVTSSRALQTLRGLRVDPVPVVVVDRVDPTEDASSVRLDNQQAAAHATEHLQGHGHEVVACIAGPWPVSNSAERVSGWRAQQLRYGAPADDTLVEHAEHSPSGGREAALALLGPKARHRTSERPAPTAILITSDTQALGVLAACAELGLRVPEDIAIASIDGASAGGYYRPSLTSVRQPVPEIARTAAAQLLDHIASPDHPVRHITLTGNLVVGASCGCPERSSI